MRYVIPPLVVLRGLSCSSGTQTDLETQLQLAAVMEACPAFQWTTDQYFHCNSISHHYSYSSLVEVFVETNWSPTDYL